MPAIPLPHHSPALEQFIDDELLRAPLLFDQVIEGAADHARKALPGLPPLPRAALADLLQWLKSSGLAARQRLTEHFVRSLREQVRSDLGTVPKSNAKQPLTLALLDEDEVALDVAMSHTITIIKSTAEYELRELQTFTAALVGDMEISGELLPLRAETYARALSAAAQALPLPRGQQAAFTHHASTPLAQLLRQSFAASCSRLESMGIEPAAYRTLILPAGSRGGLLAGHGRHTDSTYSPDLQRLRDGMPAPVASLVPIPGRANVAPLVRHPPAPSRGPLPDLRARELVRRLFEAATADTRVPPDVLNLVLHLQEPAQRLAQHDAGLLDHDTHPLWLFINRLAYEAEMAPDPHDPERLHLLKVARATIGQLTRETEPNRSLFVWALDRLDNFLQQRLARRCQAAAGQIAALQKLEDKLNAGASAPTTLHGTLDVLQLDTVPAAMLPDPANAVGSSGGSGIGNSSSPADTWLDNLRPGDWLRIFLQGRWLHVQLIWPGDRRDIWLLGDGASDATWAIRRRALATLWDARLVKTLARRSLLGQAAKSVQQRLAAA